MSRWYSPRFETANMLLVPEPMCMWWAPFLYPCSPHKLWDMASVRWCIDGMSRLYSPRPASCASGPTKILWAPLHYHCPLDESRDTVAGKRYNCNVIIIMNNKTSKERSPNIKNSSRYVSSESVKQWWAHLSPLFICLARRACNVDSRSHLAQWLITWYATRAIVSTQNVRNWASHSPDSLNLCTWPMLISPFSHFPSLSLALHWAIVINYKIYIILLGCAIELGWKSLQIS